MQLFFEVGPNVECMVGWDDPMQTFFGQVYRVDEQGERVDDEAIHWVGTHNDQIRSVDHLQQLLRPHAELPAEIH